MLHSALKPRIAVISAVLGLLALIGPSRGLAQEGRNTFISPDVATVNGETLTERELLFTLVRVFGEDLIYDLVEDQIIVSQADSMGVSLDPGAVDSYLTSVYTPEKLASLRDAFGEDVLTQTVSTQLLALQTVNAKVDQIVTDNALAVSEDEIRDMYIDALPLWTTPAAVRFSLIETATQEEAEAARQRILAGESFADVCREVSTHEDTRIYGGDIGGLVPQGYSQGEQAIMEATAFDLEVGALSSPLQVEDKWYILMTTQKTEYYEPTLEEMHDYIHAMLLDRMVQPFLQEWMDGLIDQAQIEITYPLFIDVTTSPFSPGADGSFIAPTIGTVNGNPIPEGAFFFHLLRQYGSIVVELMIEEMLFEQEGRGQMGVDVTETEVQAELSSLYDDQILQIIDATFGSDAVGITLRRHLAALQVEGIKWQQIIQDQGIEITDEMVTSFYLENLRNWVTPESVRFSLIVVDSDAAAQTARQRIETGESFETVCREVSISEETRANGGDVGTAIVRNTFTGPSQVIETTAFSLPVGSVSQPFQVGDSWLLLKVTDRTEAYEPTLPEMRERIYSSLLKDRVSPFLNGWRSTLWANAQIQVVYPIFSDNPSPDFSSDVGMLSGQ